MSIQSSGNLFELVQLLHVFVDSKTFPDAPARDGDENIQQDVDTLIRKYAQSLREISLKPNEAEYVLGAARLLYELRHELEQLVMSRFNLRDKVLGTTPHSDSMEDHIERMWDWLTRRPGDTPEQSTLLSLNYPYVVPGGRFGELYYWDSYFTSVGLLASGRIDLVCDLTRAGGGGEYPNQDGFGWTNAVVKAFIEFLNGNVFWR